MLPLSKPAPSISLQNATVIYQGKPLFENLSVDFAAGQYTCLLGPSGIGKSSLLRFLAGLLPHAFGKVSSNDQQTLQGRIAYLSQHDCLLPWLSALDNVWISLRLSKQRLTPSLRQVAINLLKDLGLAEVAHLPPHALSGGMRQRLALARILFENKPVILLDEPFSAIDAITRLQLQDLTARYFKDRTVIFVTHDPLEALRIAQHIYILAGKPAYIANTLSPSGMPPRAATDPNLLQLQGELWQYLLQAHA